MFSARIGWTAFKWGEACLLSSDSDFLDLFLGNENWPFRLIVAVVSFLSAEGILKNVSKLPFGAGLMEKIFLSRFNVYCCFTENG